MKLEKIEVYECGSEVSDEYEQQVKWLIKRVTNLQDALENAIDALRSNGLSLSQDANAAQQILEDHD